MADSLQKKIEDICEEWSKRLAEDMKISLDKALKDAGGTKPQFTLGFNNIVTVASNGDASVKVVATGDYWDFIDKGVDGTKVKHGSKYSYKKKAVDFDAVKDWIEAASIDASGIIAQIDIKKKGGLTPTNKELKKIKKGLSYDESVGRLSKIFAVAIARDGHEAKPYVDRVYNKERLKLLKDRISTVMGREIMLSLNETGGYNTIKLTV